MTAIDLTAPRLVRGAVAPSAPARTKLRMTARGRRALAAVVALPVAATLSFAVLSGGGAVATDAAGAGADAFEMVTVLPGESLWSIAESVAPDADPRDIVDAIVRVNALPNASIDAGEIIAIPASLVD